jgi:4-amino-4-deoxy-L-arabinose transferase-like glycosyltransferase
MATDPPRGGRIVRWSPILLIGLAALLRIGAVVAWSGHLADDRDDYWTVAHSYLEHGFWEPFVRFPNSFRPPLLPLMLAVLLKSGGGTVSLGVLQVILGTATVALTFYAGKRLGLGRFALLAAALVACDPLLIVYTTFPMTETLFTFLVIALVAVAIGNSPGDGSRVVAWSVGRAAAVGLLFGACALCRPTIWPTALLAAAWCGWESLRSRRLPRSLIVNAMVACLTCAVVVAPWALRNWKILGSPVVTTTHGGYTLLLGNNAEFFRHVAERPISELWRDPEPDRFQQAWFERLIAQRDREIGPTADELSQNRWMYQQAWSSIAAEPKVFLRTCALRFVLFWNVVPLLPSRSSIPRSVVWAVCVGYVAELSLFVIGLAALLWTGDRRWILSLCVILNFTLVHLIYWSNMRMRAPLVPLVGLIAAHGLSIWFNRRKVNKLVPPDHPPPVR